MLGGCRDRSRTNPPKHESPPPKPPACPPDVDLTSLRLADGQLAAVRIVKVYNTRLYIPIDWLIASWHLVDFEKAHYPERSLDSGRPDWTIIYDYTPRFKPDIHMVECPGTVHQANDNLDGYNAILLSFSRKDGVNIDKVSNISPNSSIKYIELTNDGGSEQGGTAAASAANPYLKKIREERLLRRKNQKSPKDWFDLGDGIYIDGVDQHDELNPDFGILFPGRPNYLSAIGSVSQWVLPEVKFKYDVKSSRDDLADIRTIRPQMKRLAEWLSTPPSQRDNDHMFYLGKEFSADH